MAKSKFDPRKFIRTRLVLDASVLIKALIEEENSTEIRLLMKFAKKNELAVFAPPLIIFEVLNVLAKSGRKPEEVKELFKRFQKLKIGIIEPKNKEIEKALEDATLHKSISYYDASYHALAEDMQATFLTADKKYYELMKKKGNIELLQF